MNSKSLMQWLSIISMGAILVSGIAIAEIPAVAPTSELPVAPPVLSGTLYISDDLKTALRTGASTKHRISAFLASGTPLTVISSTDDWIEVKVKADNKSGWVSRRNVQKGLGAKALLVKRDATIAQFKTSKGTLNEERQQLQSELSETRQNLAAVTGQFDRLNKEYEELQAISKAAVKNHDKMQDMREQIATIKTRAGELEIANALLKQDNYNRGIVHALIAVIFGILMTLIIPKMKKKRSSNGWD